MAPPKKSSKSTKNSKPLSTSSFSSLFTFFVLVTCCFLVAKATTTTTTTPPTTNVTHSNENLSNNIDNIKCLQRKLRAHQQANKTQVQTALNECFNTGHDDHDDHHNHDHDHEHLEHDHNHDHNHDHSPPQSDIEKSLLIFTDENKQANWIWAFLSAILITIIGLLCYLVVPSLSTHCFNFLFQFLVALAVGTLSGDALLHLIPHAFMEDHNHDTHDHHGHNHGNTTSSSSIDEHEAMHTRGVLKGLGAVTGIYVFYLIEKIMQFRRIRKEKRHRLQEAEMIEQDHHFMNSNNMNMITTTCHGHSENQLVYPHDNLNNNSSNKTSHSNHHNHYDVHQDHHDDHPDQHDEKRAMILAEERRNSLSSAQVPNFKSPDNNNNKDAGSRKNSVLMKSNSCEHQQKRSNSIDAACESSPPVRAIHVNKDLKYILPYLPNHQCDEDIDHHDHENEVEHRHKHSDMNLCSTANANGLSKKNNELVAKNGYEECVKCEDEDEENCVASKLIQSCEAPAHSFASSAPTTNTNTTTTPTNNSNSSSSHKNNLDDETETEIAKETSVKKTVKKAERKIANVTTTNSTTTTTLVTIENGEQHSVTQHLTTSQPPLERALRPIKKGGHSHLHSHSHNHHGHDHGHGHSHLNFRNHSHSNNGHKYKSSREKAHHDHHKKHEQEISDVKLIAWMVLMGDGLHNFADGLAIGASFASGLSTGFGTSIAVLCHELPHEIGDFAVLRKAGVSLSRALVFNALSGLLCLFGVLVGLLIGGFQFLTQWAFLFIAGTFLYISLVDMIPELSEDKEDDSMVNFFIQSLGILTGIGIMLLIALYESSIVSMFS